VERQIANFWNGNSSVPFMKPWMGASCKPKNVDGFTETLAILRYHFLKVI
jgi:hypothetical protein